MEVRPDLTFFHQKPLAADRILHFSNNCARSSFSDAIRRTPVFGVHPLELRGRTLSKQRRSGTTQPSGWEPGHRETGLNRLESANRGRSNWHAPSISIAA